MNALLFCKVIMSLNACAESFFMLVDFVYAYSCGTLARDVEKIVHLRRRNSIPLHIN